MLTEQASGLRHNIVAIIVFAGCRVGQNGEDALCETDEGWQLSASEAELVIEDHGVILQNCFISMDRIFLYI